MNFVWLIIEVYYVLALRKALIACLPENRVIPPAWLWLELIPGLGFVWQFGNVWVVARSLAREFTSRRLANKRPGLALGTVAFALQCVGLLFVLLSNGGAGHAVPPDRPELVWTVAFWTGWALLLLYAVLWAWYWRLISSYGAALSGESSEIEEGIDVTNRA